MSGISIIIPAYNRAGLIGETLRSLLNQTVPAKEIFIVDDGSTDGTADAVFKMLKMGDAEKLKTSEGKPWPEFQVIRQENAGPGAARNRGLKEATGEFIHFFDSDDIAAPNKHEVQLRALLETGADIAYGPWCKGRFVENERPMTDSGELMAERRVAPKIDGTTDDTDKHGFGNQQRHELTRKEEAGQRLARQAGAASGPAEALDARRSTLDAAPLNFVPEGPVLQARGLPDGDLLRPLLTNWSIVPHACLFRRSIIETAGGFPEDIWVGEDQLLFLRCLLAGAKVVHSPGTMVYYRVGDDPGKLTATGVAQKRHARDWGRFLVKANQEVTSGGWRVTSAGKKTCVTTEDTESTERAQGDSKGTCAGAAFSNPFTSELARDSENSSHTLSASGPAEASRADDAGIGSTGANQLADSKEVLEGQAQAGLQMHSQKLQSIRTANDTGASKGDSSSVPFRDIRGSHSVALDPGLSTLDATTPPAEWYAFRLRAFEAWRDLEKFFPDGEEELKNELQGIWRKNRFSVFSFEFSGFVMRKLGGLKLRLLGYREHASFQCGNARRFLHNSK